MSAEAQLFVLLAPTPTRSPQECCIGTGDCLGTEGDPEDQGTPRVLRELLEFLWAEFLFVLLIRVGQLILGSKSHFLLSGHLPLRSSKQSVDLNILNASVVIISASLNI